MKKSQYAKDLEEQIQAIVLQDNDCEASFEHKIFENKFQVLVKTYNPYKKDTFLMKIVVDETYEQCLEQIRDYLKITKKESRSWTVNWRKKGDGISHDSYFDGVDIQEVLDKFYSNKFKTEYHISSIKENPIS